MTATVTDLGGELVECTIDGLGELRFENFGPGEWLTQKGEPAKKSRRRYLLNGDEVDSVSSIVGTLDKPGLYPWHEDHGARGGVEAERMGELVGVPPEEIIKRVRFLGLGATAARDDGADRGTAIHSAFHTLATTGIAPKLSDFPVAWRGWVKGAARAWMALDPEPLDSEFMVCHPELGYAGRPDLLCRVNGQRVLIDYKTNKGRVYDQAHYQTRGYVETFSHCGIEPVDKILIVGIDDDGGFQLVDCAATPEDWSALLHTFRARKRINAAMAAARKASKAASV